MRIVLRLAGPAALVVLAATAIQLTPSAGAWLGIHHAWVSGVAILAAVVTTALRDRAAWAVRVAVVSCLLAVGIVLLSLRLAGHWPFGADPVVDPRYVAFLVAALVATTVGLALRQLWARWLGLAFGCFGALSSGLNALGWFRSASEDSWMHRTAFVGAAVIAVNLLAPDVRDATLARHPHAELWRSKDSVVRAVRGSLLANLGAVPMLLVYAWAQPFVPETSTPALALAGLLGIGSALTMRRKVGGALLLGLCALGLVAQTAVTAWRAAPGDRLLLGYYAAFWIPAALLGARAAVVLTRRALRAGE